MKIKLEIFNQKSVKELIVNTIKDYIGLLLFITILPKTDNLFFSITLGLIAYLLLTINIQILDNKEEK